MQHRNSFYIFSLIKIQVIELWLAIISLTFCKFRLCSLWSAIIMIDYVYLVIFGSLLSCISAFCNYNQKINEKNEYEFVFKCSIFTSTCNTVLTFNFKNDNYST